MRRNFELCFIFSLNMKGKGGEKKEENWQLGKSLDH